MLALQRCQAGLHLGSLRLLGAEAFLQRGPLLLDPAHARPQLLPLGLDRRDLLRQHPLLPLQRLELLLQPAPLALDQGDPLLELALLALHGGDLGLELGLFASHPRERGLEFGVLALDGFYLRLQFGALGLRLLQACGLLGQRVPHRIEHRSSLPQSQRQVVLLAREPQVHGPLRREFLLGLAQRLLCILRRPSSAVRFTLRGLELRAEVGHLLLLLDLLELHAIVELVVRPLNLGNFILQLLVVLKKPLVRQGLGVHLLLELLHVLFHLGIQFLLPQKRFFKGCLAAA
mmetsp:Transcript_144763/g.367381  ORF Transcript_144763/g.367381 Transcript_144763/m.367381 type:complete len:289 (+) Transcript_144763:1025-1891(+)